MPEWGSYLNREEMRTNSVWTAMDILEACGEKSSFAVSFGPGFKSSFLGWQKA